MRTLSDRVLMTGRRLEAKGDGMGKALVSLSAEIKQLEDDVASMEARKDAAYLERNQCVALIARMALALGYHAGLKRTNIEGWSEDWHGCVYIDLPNGQASWHYHDSHAHLFEGLPAYEGSWDGHTTEQKYERLAAFDWILAGHITNPVTGKQHPVWKTPSKEPTYILANLSDPHVHRLVVKLGRLPTFRRARSGDPWRKDHEFEDGFWYAGTDRLVRFVKWDGESFPWPPEAFEAVAPF